MMSFSRSVWGIGQTRATFCIWLKAKGDKTRVGRRFLISIPICGLKLIRRKLANLQSIYHYNQKTTSIILCQNLNVKKIAQVRWYIGLLRAL